MLPLLRSSALHNAAPYCTLHTTALHGAFMWLEALRCCTYRQDSWVVAGWEVRGMGAEGEEDWGWEAQGLAVVGWAAGVTVEVGVVMVAGG